MNWNEKIDLLKKHYSVEEFSVPHLDRKRILRQIETQFISRPKEYYDLNNHTPRFSHWWKNIQAVEELSNTSDYYSLLNSVIEPDKLFWIACEFPTGHILLYRAKLKAALSLMGIGQSWADTYHLVEQKYQFLLSVRTEGNTTSIKTVGNNKLKEKVQLVITLC